MFLVICQNLMFRALDHSTIPQDIILAQNIHDVIMIGPGEQEAADIPNALTRHMHARGKR